MSPAAIIQPSPDKLVLSGCWTARGLGTQETLLAAVRLASASEVSADAGRIDALDTAGAWVLNKLLLQWRSTGTAVTLTGLRPAFNQLLDVVAQHAVDASMATRPAKAASTTVLEGMGQRTKAALDQGVALLAFVGESALALAHSLAHPRQIRWRPILYNIRSAGFDALPIVGLLSFLLGIVVAYQGADQLRQYGANIFVADLVGLSMLREFAPLITAIIIAGRSGSAYAAQIGTMAVTEEIDAMRTLGIQPLELLVLPKIIALVVVLYRARSQSEVLGR